ncbi:MAG: amino acid adenylation domain-containing protein, partial [Bacteroidota bacterium]
DIQYKDYAEWQQSAEYQKELAKQKEFWLNEFQTVPPVLDLPADFVRPAIINTEGDTVGFELGQTDTASLKNLAEANRTTLFVVLFSIYNILLSKLSLQQDIVIGVSSAGRHKSVLENIIGMFVNTLAIRNQVSDQLTFEQLLSNITKKTLQAFNNESYQYEDLIDELKLERDASRNPLFDVMFTFENYDNESLKIDGLEISPYQHDIKESQFDLDLGVVEAEGRLIFQIDYFSKVFRKETVEQFATYFIQIVKVIVSKPSVLVANIDILSAADRRTLLFDFNDTEVGYKAEDTFVGLFERQVADTPDSVAAIHNEDSLSYQELNEYANNIAHSLQARGIKHGQVVPLLMERRINLLAWMIAVQKVGGIFISIDVRNPEARIQKILEDCDPFVVVIESGFENLVGDKDGQIIIIDADSKKNENYNEFSSENVSCEIHHDDIAYIVYTSGSTGKPKGVMIHQHGLVNHLRGLRDRLEVTNQDRFIQTAECSFDVYVVQFLLTLISGGTTHIIDREDVLSADRMMEILNEYPVTLMESVPSLIRLMLKIENENITGKINQLKWLISTGEAISAELVEDWYSKYPLVPIVNAYGPAEVSDDVTVEIIPASTTRNNQISVGKPLPNLRVYILTPSMQLCPIGVPGELYISGAGVGKGYWKDEVKTSERFIPNPFAAELPIGGHDILYKSGDLGRWTANGGITMLGRVDNMVKIRGARVETGEIEQVLNTQNDVTESLVMVKGDLGDEFLTAYYISDSEVSYSELKNHLSSKLPEFMVPSAFVHLSEWPKTLNGKLDRNALPNPEIKLEKSYVEPSTDEQRLLVKVWTEVLGIEGLGITNNFFRAGGDSIKSIQISSRMRAEGYQVTVKDLFTHQTIEELALNLKRVKVQSDQSVVEGEVPLTPIQYRLFDDFKTETHHHNQAVMLNFNQGINADQVNRMFTQIQAHHDALRMVFNTKGSEIQQRNLDLDLEVSIDEYDLVRTENPTVEMERRSNQIQASVDLINGPLMKLGLFHLANGSRLLIVIHHLVVDGVSWRILLEDMETLYGQLIEDKPLNLPLKTDSFQKWSNYLRSYVQSEQFLEAKKYWDKLGEQEIQSIPHDHDLGPVILKDNQYVDFELTTNQTKQLLIDAQVPFGTQINDLLLTALFMAFNKYGNYSTLKVDMEGHGRDTVSDDIDISRTIGWFTSVYPVLLKKNEDGVGSVIKHVKESLRKAPNNGLDYLIDQYLSNKPANDNRSQIIFNYLGQIDGEEDEGPFAISDEPAGDEISLDETRDYDFEFQSIIENGKLKMSLSYSANQFSSKSMESLMNSYEESIQEII